MDKRENMPLLEKRLESSELSEKIVEIFELCFDPDTKEELYNINLNFCEKLKDKRESQFLSDFDYACMYALDCIYKHNAPSAAAISRSLFLYQLQYELVLRGKDRNLIFNTHNDWFLKELRAFKDLIAYSKSEEMLINVGLFSILAGNLGLALYLVKFGLVEFPSEVNETCREMFKTLVDVFNSCSWSLKVNMPDGDRQRTSVRLEELLNHVKEKAINIRRSMLIFSILVVVVQHQMYDVMGRRFILLKTFTEHKKDLCFQKLKCIDLFIQATTETMITLKEIEKFTEVFLNAFLTPEIGKSLVDTCKKILGEVYSYYNPRTLKDLARCKIRSSFRDLCVPEQVNKLKLPVALKEFLNFQSKGILELLGNNHLNLSLDHKINSSIFEMNDEDGQATEDVSLRETEDGGLKDAEDGGLRVAEDGGLRVAEDGGFRDAEDGSLRETEDGGLQELDDEKLSV